MRRLTLGLAVLVTVGVPAGASAQQQKTLNMSRGRHAILTAEQRYWHSSPVTLTIGPCKRLSVLEVQCEVVIGGSFFTVTDSEGRTVPSGEAEVREVTCARLHRSRVVILPGC